ncbi:MAG: HD domain-containing protein, partial [Spirochaetaceae bacterium]|nr:HD domain-containing protein [Spirochaetaceae bacterium]
MKRKAGQPESALFGAALPDPDRDGEALLRVHLRAMGLKRLFRQGWLKRGLPEAACESVADHSFGTAILALLLAGRPPHEGVDREKAVRMALVHELCE